MATIKVLTNRFGLVTIEDTLIDCDNEKITSIKLTNGTILGEVMNYHTSELVNNPIKIEGVIESYIL